MSDHSATPYVIIFQARSGSTYLTELLDSHPHVSAVKEPLAWHRKRRKRDWNKSGIADWQQAYVSDFYAGPPDPSVRAWGFKTKLIDVLDPEAFAETLRKADVRVIALLRHNYVKAVISLLNAIRLFDKVQKWNLRGEAERLPPFAIDPDEFDEELRAYARRREAISTFVGGLGQPTETFYYEDLLADPEGTLRRVCAFLRVAEQPLESRTRKNTADDLRRVVLNFDELKDRYAGTPYAAMFDTVQSNAAAPSRLTLS